MPIQVDFSEVFEELKNAIEDLAKSTVSRYFGDAKADAHALLADMKGDLERWTLQLMNGALTTQDFEWLVNSQAGTIKMAALKQTGLAKIRIDQFKSSVLNLIVDTVFNVIKI